jgi:membrane protease YdiL (CAAX protease family)
VQHRLQARHGALKASLLVALAFAFLHAPTYLRTPISAESLVRDLSVLVIALPFAIAFRILIAFSYNRAAYVVLIAAITHASFNEASELIGPNVPGPLAQILAFASTGLLALLAVVLSRATPAYRRRSHRTEAGRHTPSSSPSAGAAPSR